MYIATIFRASDRMLTEQEKLDFKAGFAYSYANYLSNLKLIATPPDEDDFFWTMMNKLKEFRVARCSKAFVDGYWDGLTQFQERVYPNIPLKDCL